MTTYQPNTIVFSRNGHRARYVINSNQGHVVQPEIEIIAGDDCHSDWGDVTTWYEVFDKPPREVLDNEITQLNETLTGLRTQVTAVRRELSTTDADIKTRRDRLKTHSQLAQLDTFLTGKVTHYVSKTYSGISLISIEATKEDDSYRKEFALLTLFGSTAGDLNWELNRYRDGSGSWNHVYPCFSLEEAQTKRLELFEAHWAEARASEAQYFDYYYESATKQGVVVPDDIKALYKAKKVKEYQGQIEECQKRLDEAKVRLATTEAL